jgi:N-acetylglutamate synthase-like GNAT family acetyltransferase
MSDEQNNISELMLTAIELFHYSYKFKGKTIFLSFSNPDLIPELMGDMRVLLSSHINAVIFMPSSSAISSFINKSNLKGYRFCQRLSTSNEIAADFYFCRTAWEAYQIPILIDNSNYECSNFIKRSTSLAQALGAFKFILIEEKDGLFINKQFISHTSPNELLNNLNQNIESGFSTLILKELCNFQQNSHIDVGIVRAKSGLLFQELFTHRGSGTLISSSYSNLIRPARVEDIANIQFLLSPYIRSGAILPVSDEKLLDEIKDFLVYTVNSEIVAAAKLNDFENFSELAKFCTLPRYQRKGRAKQLALAILEEAKKKGKKAVFSLSLEPAMWNFLINLGFVECSYTDLPSEWLNQYDQSRGSKAFLLEI